MKLVTLPRIIGIVVLVITFLTYYAQQGTIQALLLGIAGLVFLCTPRKPAEKHWKQFLGSFTPNKEFGILLLLDALFWTLLAILTAILSIVLSGVVHQIKNVAPTEGIALNLLGGYNDVLQAAFTKGIASLIVFWLALMGAYALSRGMIWLSLNKKPLDARFFGRFFLLNLCWCTLWTAATLFFMSTLIQPYGGLAFVVMLLLYTHLTTILHNRYAQTRNARASVAAAFSSGIGAPARWIQPACYALLCYVIVSQIMRALPPGKLALGVTFVLFFLFMAWYRAYMKHLLRSPQ